MSQQGLKAGQLDIDVIAEVARLTADMDRIRKIVKDGSADIAKNTKAANDNLANLSSGMAKIMPSAKQAAFASRNLAFQFQDLGVQAAQAAASGEPLKMMLMALVMQGPQIKNALDDMGKGLFSVIGGFLAAHPLLVALTVALGVAYGAISLFASEIDKSGELDRYANSLGLTKDEMKKLGDVSVTTGDVFKALWQTIDQGLGASKIFAAIKSWAIDTFKTALTWAQNFAAGAYAVIAGTVKIIGTLATAAKQVLQGDFAGALTTVVTGRVMDAYATAFGEAKKAMSGFWTDVADKAMDNAKARIGARASELIDKRAEKKMKDRAKEVGGLLADVMSGAFLARFALEMQKHPIIDMDKVVFNDPTIGERMRREEEQREWEEKVEKARKETEDYLDQRARDRFINAAHDFADIVGGKIGGIISQMASILDRFAPGISKALGGLFEKLDASLGGLLKNAGIGGISAAATGGSGLGGMAGGAIGGKLGEKFLTAGLDKVFQGLGQFAGPLGAIAGGILGGVVGGMFKKVKKASATVEIIAGEAMQTSLTGNSAKLKKVAGAMADGLIGGLTGIADQLGGLLGGAVKISIGKRKDTFRVDTAGLGRTKNMPSFDTEEDAIQFAIQQAIMQGAITGLRAGTEALIKGEGDLQEQLQKALRFEGVFKDLAQRANPLIAGLNDIAKEFDQLIDIFEEAGASAEDYAKLQELMAIRQREAIEQAFEPIRAMLDDLKSKASEAGDAVRSAYDAVLQREAAAIDAYQSALAQQQQKAAEAAAAAVRAAQQRTIDSLKSGIDSLRQAASGFADVAKRIREFAAGAIGDPSLASLRASFADTAARAQAGDLNAMSSLPDIGAALRASVTANATDRVSMIRELAQIAAQADKAAEVAEGSATAAEQQLAAMQAQLDAMQAIEEAAASTDETVASIADLLADMQTAVAAADLAREQMAKYDELKDVELTFGEAVAAYEKAKADRDDLIRQITSAGFADLIVAQQQTGAQMVAALSQAAAQAAKASADAATAISAAQAAQAAAAEKAANDNAMWQSWIGQIPFFADGGTHSGGWRVVGERGPELEYTGPSQIVSADRIAAAMLGGSDAGQIGDAVADRLRPLLFQIAKNTGKSADVTKRWEIDGMPPERDVA